MPMSRSIWVFVAACAIGLIAQAAPAADAKPDASKMPHMTEDGKYAADTTVYIVSVVNFDLTVIDIPELASSANETLEWEYNPDVVPAKGATVWMIIEPAGKDATTKPAIEKTKADAGGP